jgi:hypothetical protein
MSFFTAKYIRECLDGVPDDEPVFGIIFTRAENEVDAVDEDGNYGSRVTTPAEWEKIVERAESYAEPYGFNSLWECLNDAKSEVVTCD